MQHELSITNSAEADIWTDFGYSAERLKTASKVMGAGMIEQMDRIDVTTKTEAFARTLEQHGDKLGIPLETPTDYFILGATFATTIKAMTMAQRHLARKFLSTPLKLAAL